MKLSYLTSRLPILFLAFVFLFELSAQTDFNTIYRQNDAARDSTEIAVKKRIHQERLAHAVQQSDTFQIILNNMYLANDNVLSSDYEEVTRRLIAAENYANSIADTLLLGRIKHKQAAVYFMLRNNVEAIKQFTAALQLNNAAKDSQYMAITLEQLGANYQYTNEFDQSNACYQRAIPLIEKYWGSKTLSVTLNNYGNSLSEQKDSMAKAISIYKKAIQAAEQISDEYTLIAPKQNLALAYSEIDSLEQALQIYKACKSINEKNEWLDYQVRCYEGLAKTYQKLGEVDSAFYYFKQYHALNDSVFGVGVQNKINALETENELYKKDLLIIQKEKAVAQQKQKNQTILFFSTIAIALTLLSMWLLIRRRKRMKMRLIENQIELQRYIDLLSNKNSELRDLKNELSITKATTNLVEENTIGSVNVYDMSILTNADWENFKSLFEKSHPKYLQRIRTAFPDITAAEERLFLLIKLKLTTRESANILGIQPETVKKTRTRLRKKLNLNPSDSLEAFIQNF